MTKKWEYRVEMPSADAGNVNLDALGAEGWELVSFDRNTELEVKLILIFKRPLTEPKPEE